MGGGDDFLGHVFVGVMFLGVKVGKKNENEGGVKYLKYIRSCER
jgi:hypothetical protein